MVRLNRSSYATFVILFAISVFLGLVAFVGVVFLFRTFQASSEFAFGQWENLAAGLGVIIGIPTALAGALAAIRTADAAYKVSLLGERREAVVRVESVSRDALEKNRQLLDCYRLVLHRTLTFINSVGYLTFADTKADSSQNLMGILMTVSGNRREQVSTLLDDLIEAIDQFAVTFRQTLLNQFGRKLWRYSISENLKNAEVAAHFKAMLTAADNRRLIQSYSVEHLDDSLVQLLNYIDVHSDTKIREDRGIVGSLYYAFRMKEILDEFYSRNRAVMSYQGVSLACAMLVAGFVSLPHSRFATSENYNVGAALFALFGLIFPDDACIRKMVEEELSAAYENAGNIGIDIRQFGDILSQSNVSDLASQYRDASRFLLRFGSELFGASFSPYLRDLAAVLRSG